VNSPFERKKTFPLFLHSCHVNKHAVLIIIILNVDAINNDFAANPKIQTEEVDD